MNKFNRTDKHYWSNRLTRIALIIISVSLIVFFLPRNSGPQFRYDVGKPWMYSSLIAKFDFPIYKTDEALKAEQDSIMRSFEPYYNYNPAVEQEQTAKFMADYGTGIQGLSYEYVRIVADRLHRLYQTGIMETSQYSTISRDTTSMIRIVNGKTATSTGIVCVYSTMSAYEKLFTDPMLAAQRQTLQKCNLNNYLQPNLTYDEERSETEKADILSGIPQASGMQLSGQKIIDRGEIVNEYIYRVLNSFEKETKRRSATVRTIPSTIAG